MAKFFYFSKSLIFCTFYVLLLNTSINISSIRSHFVAITAITHHLVENAKFKTKQSLNQMKKVSSTYVFDSPKALRSACKVNRLLRNTGISLLCIPKSKWNNAKNKSIINRYSVDWFICRYFFYWFSKVRSNASRCFWFQIVNNSDFM